MALATLQAVVTSTPVDTGAARANWIVSTTGAPSDETRRAFVEGEGGSTGDANAFQAIAVGSSRISRYRGRTGIFISNNLPYIDALNNGSSAQAPAGFVEDAIQVGNAVARRQTVLR